MILDNSLKSDGVKYKYPRNIQIIVIRKNKGKKNILTILKKFL